MFYIVNILGHSLLRIFFFRARRGIDELGAPRNTTHGRRVPKETPCAVLKSQCPSMFTTERHYEQGFLEILFMAAEYQQKKKVPYVVALLGLCFLFL